MKTWIRTLALALLIAGLAAPTVWAGGGGGGRGGRGGRGGMGGPGGGMGGPGGGMGGPGLMTTDPNGDPLPGGPGGVVGPAGMGGGMGGPGGMGRTTGMSLQSTLGSPDDEWAVLQPKIQKISDAQTLLNSATYNMVMMSAYGGGRGGRNFGGMTAATSPATSSGPTVTSTFADLYQALNAMPAPADDVIKAKLDAYRKAKEKTDQDLAKAREDLKTYVTLRQEAILISLGYLE